MGRLDPFAEPPPIDRYLRQADLKRDAALFVPLWVQPVWKHLDLI
jgi:hypothetical protein